MIISIETTVSNQIDDTMAVISIAIEPLKYDDVPDRSNNLNDVVAIKRRKERKIERKGKCYNDISIYMLYC
jgi:hypothetical protein